MIIPAELGYPAKGDPDHNIVGPKWVSVLCLLEWNRMRQKNSPLIMPYLVSWGFYLPIILSFKKKKNIM